MASVSGATGDDVHAALCSPDFYPDRPERVDVRETHISWVFLAGDRAYKLKKPLVLPFLDYGTPQRRLEMCREEVTLNRSLAPEMYLGVRAVALRAERLVLADEGDPAAVDYLVEMRRYDECMTMAVRLGRGDVHAGEAAALGVALARFHAGAPRVPATGSPLRALERRMSENFHELLAIIEQRAEIEWVLALERFAHSFAVAHAHLLDERTRDGLIREVHGDLRADHVLLDGSIRIVDRIEFDRGLRELDVADDLAFLVPAQSHDYGRESVAARDLLALAERFAWQARLPLVIVICGLPAAGKSRLARALAELSHLPYLSSDRTRKRLAGVAARSRAAAAAYTPEFSRLTYLELGRRAARATLACGGAVVDATFRHRAERESFADAFARAAPLMFVELRAPARVLVERAAERERRARTVSDATLPVVVHESGSWEPLDEVPAHAHLVLRSDRAVDVQVDDLRALLDARLSAYAYAS